ncbi:hypothetical protein CWB72_17245 [Pseudoalteromonas phenolica]|uniref:hypothetical protein n=1 Tax=Pseudoalteromonas phenolica TaxID=161398 RepID=UPI00110B840B|nr:hypothetical protein [Pseudoalteromonas phenolica]TMN87014.1 hypothetical protein CWB72_17245 [Pseudoalteromonas phenolica]
MRYQAPALVIFEALSLEEGLYYHHGTPFTGVAVYTEDDIVKNSQAFEQGKAVGEYQFPYIKVRQPCILDSLLDDESGRYTYQGDVFDGTVFVLEGDYIRKITFCVKGFYEYGTEQYFSDPECYSSLYYKIENMEYSYDWESPEIISKYTAIYDGPSKEMLQLYFNDKGEIRIIEFSGEYKSIFEQNSLLPQSALKIDCFSAIAHFIGKTPIELELSSCDKSTTIEILQAAQHWPIYQVFFKELAMSNLETLKEVPITAVTSVRAFRLNAVTLEQCLAYRDTHFPHIEILIDNIDD